MDKNIKTIIGIIITVVIIAIGYGIYKKSNQPVPAEPAATKPVKEEVIKIGAILPLSGDLAFLGEEIKKGIDMAVDEAKTKDINFKVIYEDDQSLSPTATVNAANKLVNIDKVDLGLTMLVEESRQIAPIFNNKKVPLLVLWDSNKFIQESGEYIFSNGFSTGNAGEIMASYAFDKLGLKKVAIVRHIDPWAEVISETFGNEFKNLGGDIVYDEKFQVDTNDYRTAIAKIKQVNPDGVYFPLIPMDSAKFLTQSKQLGLNATFLTGDAFIQDVIDASGNLADGVYYTNIYTDDSDALTVKYKEMYNSDPLDITLISFGYDGVAKIAEKMQNQKKQSIKSILDSILGKKRSVDRIEKIYKVINGVAVEVK